MQAGLSHSKALPLPNARYPSCWKLINDAVSRSPDSLAVISLHQAPSKYGITSRPLDQAAYMEQPYLRWTFRDVHQVSIKLARGLSASGVDADTPVFTFLPNGAELVIVTWACSMLGSRLVCLNPRNLANRAELEAMVALALKDTRKATNEAVVIADTTSAAKIDGIAALGHAHRFIVDSAEWEAWKTFVSLLDKQSEVGSLPDFRQVRADNLTDNAMFFTSGTTTQPKGIHFHYPHFLSAMVATDEAGGNRYARSCEDVWAIVGPNNHLLCYLFLMGAHSSGCAVVFPSGHFDADAFLKAAELERVTHTAIVPTMVEQIVAAESRLGRPTQTFFKDIILGGSGVSPAVLTTCVETLGSEGVEVVYGNTEGVWVRSGVSVPADLVKGVDVSVGVCTPGCQIKICAPGRKTPVPLGEPGDLHFQSISLADGYVGMQSDEFYHDEDGERWMRTGDQAVMELDGRIFIRGRYKDMIIRGGENISPAAIEMCIHKALPHLAHLQVQVVGAPHEAAGEVPVAVTAQPVDTQTAKDIQTAVAAHMGQMFAIDEVVSIEDLGLAQLPLTMAGKIQKAKLRELLRQRIEVSTTNLQGGPGVSPRQQLEVQVQQILARTVGVDAGVLRSDTELKDIGDSISLMRFRDRISKRTGRSLSLEQMQRARTIGDVVTVLLEQTPDSGHDEAWSLSSGSVVTMQSMIHTLGDEAKYSASKRLILGTIQPYGLTWHDVDAVFPAYDFTQTQVRNGTFERWSTKVGVVCKGHRVSDLKSALLQALANNPMQASFLVHDENVLGDNIALHVVLKSRNDFLEGRISECGRTTSVDEFRRMVIRDIKHPVLPGPLVHASLHHLQAEQCAAMIFNLHHSVTDASFMQIVLEDLDVALSGRALKPYIPYQLFCESFLALRSSPAAQVATKYHVDKLRNLSHHRQHVWPPLELPFLPEEENADGYIHLFPAATVLKSCKRHGNISPSVILKAANALFLIHQSGHDHALFAHVEAARDSMPFMPASLARTAKLEASDVGGQLFQSVVNIISPGPSETVLAFLGRLRKEQDLQHQHCAAPWGEIMAQLNQDSGALFPVLAAWCMFNWLGTSYTGDKAFANLEIVATACRKDIVPFVNNCALQRDPDGNRIMLHLRSAVLDTQLLPAFARQIAAIADWLSEETHENKSITSFASALEDGLP